MRNADFVMHQTAHSTATTPKTIQTAALTIYLYRQTYKSTNMESVTDTYRTQIEECNDSISKANDAPTEITLRPYTARVPSDHFPVMVQVSI